MARRGSRLIPRKTLTGRHRAIQVSDDSVRFDNRRSKTKYETFELVQCTVQPATGIERMLLDEGIRNADFYTLYTETPVVGVVEGTNNTGDQIIWGDPNTEQEDWYTVVKVKIYQSGVIPHYEALIVKEVEK